MLAGMERTDVQLTGEKGYLAVTRNLKDDVVVDTTYRYGLDNGTLVCRKEHAKNPYRFRIATEVLPKSDEMTAERYAEVWRSTHPGQKMRMLQEIHFDEHAAFLVVYFEDIGN